mgnify:FL=1
MGIEVRPLPPTGDPEDWGADPKVSPELPPEVPPADTPLPAQELPESLELPAEPVTAGNG